MSTDRSFSTMLNDFLPNELLKEEFVKRDYVMQNVEKDDGWKGGPLIVPFKAAGASSVSFGSLTASNDVAEDKYVRGTVSAPKEVSGTMIFNYRDLIEHDKISEQNFLKLLPDTVDDFMSYMKNVVSTNFLNGSYFAKLTATGDASGNITVDHPDRFMIGQKIIVDDDDSSPTTAYVLTININTGVVNAVTTRGGATPADFSGYTVAQNAKVYNDGAQSNSFSSLRGALLSAANGGDASLYGQTKTAYTYLQAINVDGGAAGLNITQTNILTQIFNALVTVRRLGKGNPMEILMSYTNLGYCMAAIEAQKGAFNVVPGSQKSSSYGWMEMMVGSVTKGMLKIVGIQEAEDDVIMIIDWRAVKFYSNGFFRKVKSPDGNEYFTVRNTTGYQYLIDIMLFGELVVQRPSYCGIIYGIAIS